MQSILFNITNMSVNEDRYVFLVEWFDTTASLIRSYNLTYYLKDGAIEMVIFW